jgi:hypothetical protein
MLLFQWKIWWFNKAEVIKLLLNKCIKSKDVNYLQNLALLSGWVFIQRKFNNESDISTLSTANTEKLKWKMKDERWKMKNKEAKKQRNKETKKQKFIKA